MIEWFRAGGFMMWFVLISGLVAFVLAVDAGRKVWRDPSEPRNVRAEIDGVLFWGGFASVLGLFSTLVGLALTAGAIERAGGATASLIWGGFRVALIPTVFGLLVLTLSLATWYGLRTALRRRSTAWLPGSETGARVPS